jgi:hypothetical protein
MLSCSFSGHPFAHQFLVMPQCPTPLLGRDILTKFQASISFTWLAMASPSDFTSQTLPSGVDPRVWDMDTPSLATCPPIKILLQDPHHFPCQPQYPLPTSSLLGLQPVINDLLQKGLLRPTHSPYNSPILAVKKSNGTYRLVQDLKLINNAVKPIHPLVPNSYTILSFIPASSTHFSVLDFKDAFFTIPLTHRTSLLSPGRTHTTLNNSPGQSSLRVLGIAPIYLARRLLAISKISISLGPPSSNTWMIYSCVAPL